MTRVLMSTQGRYEVSEVKYGRVYRWHPGHIVVECECGQRPSLTNFMSSCGECGTDHIESIQQWLEVLKEAIEDKVIHPWRYEHSLSEDSGLPF